jgi:hypothetical protein
MKKKTRMNFSRQITHLRLLNFTLLFGLVGVLFLFFAAAAPIPGYYGSVEQDQVNRINGQRAAIGRGSLKHIECLNTVAELWTKKMVDRGGISHNPSLANEVQYVCGGAWSILGENVGVGYSSDGIFTAFMNSPGHKANIIDGRFTKVGTGAYWSPDGRLFVTQVFANCSSCTAPWNTNASLPADPVAPAPPAKPVDYTHLLRNSSSGGSPDIGFKYGISTYRTVYCDWDGNGTDTIGMYDNGMWYIRNSNTAGSPDIVISYGYAAAAPVCGDWDGNGTETIGVYDAGNWNLRNSNDGGSPHIAFAYGYAGTTPVVGDWDGNGTDTVGIYLNGNWDLRNSNSAGRPDASFAYGVQGYRPVVGDWDGNGTDTVGIYEGAGWWHLKNANQAGAPNINFQYGASQYIPVAGDWNGDRTSTVGVVTQ